MSKTLIHISATKEHGALLITGAVKGDVAYLTIDGYISRWGDASAKTLKNEINKLKAKTADLYINSEGGDCFQANEIVNVLNDTFGKANINVRVGALAASAASYILATFSTNATAKRNTQFMIHKPSGGFFGNAAKVKQELKLLEDMEAAYRDLYATTFGMTAEQIDEKWNNGDWWLTAKEAKATGLIAEIEDEDEDITPDARLKLVAAAAPIIPKEQTSKPDIMNKEALAISMGLPKDATDAQIEAKAIELKAAADNAVTLQGKLDQQEKDSKSSKITAILDQAENVDKKITGDQRPMLEAMLNADLDNGKKYIESLTAVKAIDRNPGAQNPGGDATLTAEQQKWTYEDFQKAPNGAELLATLEENDPEAYKALVEAAYPEKNPN